MKSVDELQGCIVWIIAALIFVLWCIISIVCLMKGGSFFGIEIETDAIMSKVAAHAGEGHAGRCLNNHRVAFPYIHSSFPVIHH